MLDFLLGQGPQWKQLISSIPIALCVIIGQLITCYITITVLHVFILLNKIKSNQFKFDQKYFSVLFSSNIFMFITILIFYYYSIYVYSIYS